MHLAVFVEGLGDEAVAIDGEELGEGAFTSRSGTVPSLRESPWRVAEYLDTPQGAHARVLAIGSGRRQWTPDA